MMRHTILVFMLLAVPAAIAAEPKGSATPSAVGFASATVVNPIAVQAVRDLSFGTLIIGLHSSGLVVIEPGEGAARYGGSAQPACRSGCAPPHAARFAVTGEAGRRYSITVPVSSDSVSVLRISEIQIKTASQPSAGLSGQINFLGQDQFDLGGTLQVPAGQPPAHYQAILPVIMAYD